jgi:pimeloyl-ACP methyl ester carboxylesterase
VPEVRSDPESRTIRLAFVRLQSRAERPAAPLVYLAGGPGGSATWQAEEPRWLANWLPILEVYDVILLDQRGTGASEPDLAYRWDGEPPLRLFADPELALAHFLEMGRRARAAIVERGIDPRGYTTPESADDVEDLRRALGLEKVSLLGFSYGTHLALSVLRRHPGSIENAVLAGVEGPDHTWKLPLMLDTQLEKLSLLVARDERVGPRVPDLGALLRRVLAKLEREPVVVTIGDGQGNRFELPIGPFGLKMILRWDVGDASDLPVFPRLLHDLDRGDLSTLTWFVQKRAGSALGINGMSLLVDGASAASAERLAMIHSQAARSLFGNLMNFPFPEANEVWRPADAGDDHRATLVSGVRTLFLSGTLDWNSPPHQAEEVRWGFSDATHLIVDNAGHEQVLPHPEIERAIVRFLRGEDVRDVDAAGPPLRFVPLEGCDPEVTHPSVPPCP